MATTHDVQKQDATPQEEVRQEFKQEIIGRLDSLSVGQLYEVLELMKIMGAARGEGDTTAEAGGDAFIERMRKLREESQVTDEEFDEFDRILRESDEAEKLRLASSSRE